MKVEYVPRIDVDAALDPNGGLWNGPRLEAVKLLGTPEGLQPTDAIRASAKADVALWGMRTQPGSGWAATNWRATFLASPSAAWTQAHRRT